MNVGERNSFFYIFFLLLLATNCKAGVTFCNTSPYPVRIAMMSQKPGRPSQTINGWWNYTPGLCTHIDESPADEVSKSLYIYAESDSSPIHLWDEDSDGHLTWSLSGSGASRLPVCVGSDAMTDKPYVYDPGCPGKRTVLFAQAQQTNGTTMMIGLGRGGQFTFHDDVSYYMPLSEHVAGCNADQNAGSCDDPPTKGEKDMWAGTWYIPEPGLSLCGFHGNERSENGTCWVEPLYQSPYAITADKRQYGIKVRCHAGPHEPFFGGGHADYFLTGVIVTADPKVCTVSKETPAGCTSENVQRCQKKRFLDESRDGPEYDCPSSSPFYNWCRDGKTRVY